MPQPSDTPSDRPRHRRVDVEVPEGLWEHFAQNATQDDLTPSEAVGRALSAYVVIREGQREGALFLLMAPDGTVERLTFTE